MFGLKTPVLRLFLGGFQGFLGEHDFLSIFLYTSQRFVLARVARQNGKSIHFFSTTQQIRIPTRPTPAHWHLQTANFKACLNKIVTFLENVRKRLTRISTINVADNRAIIDKKPTVKTDLFKYFRNYFSLSSTNHAKQITENQSRKTYHAKQWLFTHQFSSRKTKTLPTAIDCSRTWKS